MEEKFITPETREKMLALLNDYYDFNDELVTREYNPIELSDFLNLMEAVK